MESQLETTNLHSDSITKVNILEDEPYHTDLTFKEVIKNREVHAFLTSLTLV